MEWTNEMVEAAHSGKINKLRGLLSTGVDPNSRGQIQAPIRGACTASRTALHVAAIALQCECILELVRHGAYVNIQDEDGYTPAHYVCQKYISSDEEGARASECLKVLFKFGGSVRIKTYNGALSLLDLATRSGNLACLKVIEKEGTVVYTACDDHGIVFICLCHTLWSLWRLL